MKWYEFKVMGPYGKMRIAKIKKMKITKERNKARKIIAKQARLDGLKEYWRKKKFETVLQKQLENYPIPPMDVVDAGKDSPLAMESVDAGKVSPLVVSEAQAPGLETRAIFVPGVDKKACVNMGEGDGDEGDEDEDDCENSLSAEKKKEMCIQS